MGWVVCSCSLGDGHLWGRGWSQAVNGLDQGGNQVEEVRFRDLFPSLFFSFLYLSFFPIYVSEKREQKG